MTVPESPGLQAALTLKSFLQLDKGREIVEGISNEVSEQQHPSSSLETQKPGPT